MASTTVDESVKQAFLKAGIKVESGILQKCATAATQLRLTPDQLVNCWEVYRCNKNAMNLALNDDTFDALRALLVKESDANITSTRGAVERKHPLPAQVTPPAKRSQTVAPKSTKVAGAAVPITPSKPLYQERKGAGKITESYKGKAKATERKSLAGSSVRCVIDSAYESNVQAPYRYGFTTLPDRAAALDEVLCQREEEIMEETEGDVNWSLVGVPCQEPVTVVGRICNSAHEGKLHKTTVLLEGTRDKSGGARIPVDLQHIKGDYSLFSGQVVAIEGMNSGGHKLVAQSIGSEGIAPPVSSTSVSVMKDHLKQQDGQPLRIVTVAGPYTTSDNTEFAPLMDFLQAVVTKEEPDVVIMLGPFVDATNHPEFKEGHAFVKDEDGEKIPVPFETFFVQSISSLLQEFIESTEGTPTQFVLCPSIDDASAEPVFPQAPLADRDPHQTEVSGGEGIVVGTLELSDLTSSSKGFSRVHSVSNPCTFTINECIVGITSNDVIFKLSTEMASANLAPGSRMTRIAEHLIKQRSYYPVFPPAENVNLDWKFKDQWAMPCRPDLLIVPSKLREFAKPILDNSILAINPGKLTRDTTGGTYAVIDIEPKTSEEITGAGDEDAEIEHNIPDRARVEVRKI